MTSIFSSFFGLGTAPPTAVIEFERNPPIFYRGQTVRGWIEVNTQKQLVLDSLGYFVDVSMSTNWVGESKDPSTIAQAHYAISQEVDLREQTLEAGGTKFAFTYSIPDDSEKAPDSFRSRINDGETSVTYQVYPRIVFAGKEHEPARATFYVVSAQPSNPPAETSLVVTPSYVSAGPVEFKAMLDKPSYAAGDRAEIRLVTKNETGSEIRLLSFSLYQKYKLSSGSTTVNGISRVHTEGISAAAIKRDFWGCQYFNFPIPAEVTYGPTSTSGHFSISYYLRLQASIPSYPGLSPTSLDVEIPIEIHHHREPGRLITFPEPVPHPTIFWRPPWQEDNASSSCNKCSTAFGGFLSTVRRHHCRHCGNIYCGNCVVQMPIPGLDYHTPVYVCLECKPEVETTGGTFYCDRSQQKE